MDNIYNSVIEALIFASDDPLTPAEIINAIKEIADRIMRSLKMI